MQMIENQNCVIDAALPLPEETRSFPQIPEVNKWAIKNQKVI